MSVARQGVPGATRTCPHCRATILESAAVCPGCKHHLRFEPGAVQRAAPGFSALQVEGTIRHPAVGEAWEYAMVVTIRNDRGEEIARQVIGVGALQPQEARSFSLSVEVSKPAEAKPAKG
jgi:hypothetical protein